MSSVEFLVKLRDACQMIADAANEQLEKMAPAEVKWNPENIRWTQAEGTKGPYQRYPAQGEKPEATDDYKAMLQVLKKHNGALHHEGYFYWLFQGSCDCWKTQEVSPSWDYGGEASAWTPWRSPLVLVAHAPQTP